MIYRIKQFYRGLFAKVTLEDQQFLKKHLSKQEICLFRRLRIGEQRHCLNIAYDCLAINEHNPTLIKAALLHDVGKVQSNLTLINKAFVVLVIKLNIPGKMLPQFIKEALYYKKHHPELGAKILEKIGTQSPVIFLTRYHHREALNNPFRAEEFPIKDSQQDLVKNLAILQKIDEKN